MTVTEAEIPAANRQNGRRFWRLSCQALNVRSSITTPYLQQIAAVGHDRHGHRGPAFQMADRFPVYQIEDLDLYAQRVLGPRVNSTAELRDAATSEGAK